MPDRESALQPGTVELPNRGRIQEAGVSFSRALFGRVDHGLAAAAAGIAAAAGLSEPNGGSMEDSLMEIASQAFDTMNKMSNLTKLLPLLSFAVGLAQTPPAATPPAPKPAVKPASAKPAAPKPAAPKAAPKPAAVKPAIAKTATGKPKDPTDKVVLTVGAEKLTVADFERLVDSLPEQFRTQVRGVGKRQFLEQLVQIKVLSLEARRRKIDQTPGFLAQAAFQRDNLLAQSLYQDISANLKIDEAEARKYFEQHKGESEQVRARHILIKAKGSPMPAAPDKKELSDEEALAKAREIRKRILAGEDFATLAKAESDDKGSGLNGGDLGMFKHGQMVPAFDAAAFTQPIGEVGEPVKTQFGYHVIKVEQRDVKTFDELRPELEKKMRPELARKAMDELRKGSTVVVDDSFFGAPPAPPKP